MQSNTDEVIYETRKKIIQEKLRLIFEDFTVKLTPLEVINALEIARSNKVTQSEIDFLEKKGVLASIRQLQEISKDPAINEFNQLISSELEKLQTKVGSNEELKDTDPELGLIELLIKHGTLFQSSANSSTGTILSERMILQGLGFTNEVLHSWQPSPISPLGGFQSEHLQILRYLISNNMTPMQAIHEINQLNWVAVALLEKFFNRGLRGDHLRELEKSMDKAFPGKNVFEETYLALDECIDKENMSIDTALNFVKKMNMSQLSKYTVD